MTGYRARIYERNLADDAALAVSSELPSLPAAALKSEPLDEVYRSLEPVTDITFSWPELVTADLVAFAQWRQGVMLGPGDTVELFLDEVSQGGPQAHGVEPGYGYHVRLLSSPATFSSLRWRITLSGGGAPYLQIARPWIALGWTPSRGYEWAHPWRWVSGDLTARNPRSGRVESDAGARWRSQTLTWPLASDADVIAFERLDLLAGSARQIALVADPARAATRTIFGRLAETSEFSPLHLGLTGKTLQIEEDG